MELSITGMLEVSPNLLLAVTGKKKTAVFKVYIKMLFFLKMVSLLEIGN